MKKALLATDFGVQSLLLTAIGVSSVTIVLPLLLMIPLGGWQLGSALVKGVAWRSRAHLAYFGLAALYCLALSAAGAGMVEVHFSSKAIEEIWSQEAWGLLFFVAIPLVGAVQYWRISCRDWRRETEETLV